jgi:hypothetical protein
MLSILGIAGALKLYNTVSKEKLSLEIINNKATALGVLWSKLTFA